ncbi:nucleotide disphospho-sugar-binding domain-containing protein [Lentzea sp. NPDC059081]|uniref:nucleotide disphospho-sugar-binding domain-containing protein n=1 Tax=Lentzea sp. NPDC059081 TaxID=3346719 RepID=UPI0036CBA848
MSVFASALNSAGAREVTFVSGAELADLARDIPFLPLKTTQDSNSGIAERTEQDDRSARNLTDFLQATRGGAAAALLAQTRRRRAEPLAAPARVVRELRAVHDQVRPDWYVVDQIDYATTLALHALGLPFVSYVTGHPTYLVTRDDQFFGLPQAWPSAVRPSAAELAVLSTEVRLTDLALTAAFTRFLRDFAPARPVPRRAFALTSPHAAVVNYPELPWLPPLPEHQRQIFLGHCTSPEPLDDTWRARTHGRRVVLVALGTFLSARHDVLRTVVQGVLRVPEVTVVVAAGGRVAELADLAEDPRVFVESVVPQRALLPHVAAMVHHGGNNSFTECLEAGVPAVVLPFSSDQFCIAHDAERAGAGVCLDPNAARPEDVATVLRSVLSEPAPFAGLRDAVRAAGPERGAARLLEELDRA